jgi:predicted enzyme related to lactoylglutathione lyase
MTSTRQRQTGDGLFAWYDIMAVDETVTNPFYSGLFGWDFSAEPRPADGYRMVTFQGQGLGGSLPFKTESGRSHWMGYIQVTGIEDHVARARELGAVIFVELMEIPDVGKFAVLDDPTGAPFYLYEIVPEYRATSTGYDRGPGHIIWNELITNDLATASDFYREIAGWELAPMSPDPLSYTVAKIDGAPVAGLFQPADPPAHSAWIMSVNTDDIDATIARALELGGEVIHAANTVPGVGRTAWIADPAGGVIGLMQPEAGWLDRL